MTSLIFAFFGIESFQTFKGRREHNSRGQKRKKPSRTELSRLKKSYHSRLSGVVWVDSKTGPTFVPNFGSLLKCSLKSHLIFILPFQTIFYSGPQILTERERKIIFFFVAKKSIEKF